MEIWRRAGREAMTLNDGPDGRPPACLIPSDALEDGILPLKRMEQATSRQQMVGRVQGWGMGNENGDEDGDGDGGSILQYGRHCKNSQGSSPGGRGLVESSRWEESAGRRGRGAAHGSRSEAWGFAG